MIPGVKELISVVIAFNLVEKQRVMMQKVNGSHCKRKVIKLLRRGELHGLVVKDRSIKADTELIP